MKCVQSSENVVGVFAKGLVDLNEPKENDKKAVGIRDVREGQGPSNEDVSGAKKNIMGANCRPSGNTVHPPADAHSHRVQPQGQSVCWERFLPVRSLKVLLVESDDSTRHVVSALLRNCSYEVTAVSNGIEAWKILADLDNQIDLVLTEVVMSGLSGVGLLSKIMTHKSCRNIPVIMMSCYDSMGIVLKCLSKGAADFLVKPIRKNELKNLWQHVWRRCHSSSGSGSESGVGNEKSMTEKSAHESDNDTGSNNEDDSRSFGLQGRNGSDNGSGTQSSWTKKAAEVDSPQPLSLRDQLSDPPDSTCGHVTYPRSEAFASSWLPASMDECRGQENQHESQQKAPSIKALVTETEENQSPQPDLNQKNDGGNTDKKLEISNDKPKGNRIRQAVNISGDIVFTEIHSRGSPGSGMPDVFPEIHRNKDNFVVDIQKQPSLELSLNRLGDRAEASINVSEQNILRHSELSAFTRYNTCSTVNQGLIGNVGSCSPADSSAEGAKKPNSDSTPNQNSNSGSNNNDMGSTTNRSFTKPDKTPEKSILKPSYQTLTFKPEKRSPTFNSALVASSKTNPEVVDVKLQENDVCTKTDDFFIESMNEKVIEGGSLNGKAAPNEAKGIYCSVNGSVCGSNQGTNAQNGGSSAVKADGITMAHGSGIAAVDCTGNGSGSGSGVGMDQSRSAIREAALSKFRQKRKERCFDKKVRYQNRKKLAEQRPRVRGQFVRHVQDSKGEDADS